MTLEDLSLLSRNERARMFVLVVVLIAAILAASAHYLQPAPPRRIVLATGLVDGLFHRHAQRYIELLARQGVTVEERLTRGAGDNLALLADPKSGVDIAFTQGGVAHLPESKDVVMLASLYYVPMWIFYREKDMLTQVNKLRGKRIADGLEGSGTRALAEPVLKANGLTAWNVNLVTLSNTAAL